MDESHGVNIAKISPSFWPGRGVGFEKEKKK